MATKDINPLDVVIGKSEYDRIAVLVWMKFILVYWHGMGDTVGKSKSEMRRIAIQKENG